MQVHNLELAPISSADHVPEVVHGTYERFWPSISTQGLSKMKRNHIHLAAGMPGEAGVISGKPTGFGKPHLLHIALTSLLSQSPLLSHVYHCCVRACLFVYVCSYAHLNILHAVAGMRRSCEVYIYIDLKKALAGTC